MDHFGHPGRVLSGPVSGYRFSPAPARTVLYDQRVPMRPDWENVVPTLFDAIAAQPEVDPRHIVLVGRSLGGLLAPRGAAGERRLAGKILFDHLTGPKQFRLFTKAEGAEGHCEGMAPIVFWDAAFNWLDSLLPD
jgi:dienelactone hydrolase